MHQRLRCLGIFVAAAGAAACGLVACGPVHRETFQDDSALPSGITAVRLEAGSGDVNVHGTHGNGSAPGGSLHRKVQYSGDKPGATHRVENGVLVLRGCGEDCTVNYVVDVPAGVPVSGTASSGEVSLAEVGAVEVATNSGGIEIDGASGPVDARTSNGPISGKGIAGRRIRAQTSNGAIDLTPDTPQDVQATTSNGDITLTVPKARYKVTAHTSNGDKHVDVPDDPAGAHELALKTSNGDITVKNP
ncbi:DUF4097 family beta strand repeat-containing protein [Streptomyces sp. NPDC046197]|uniref:DUF4097 family beta strand repeat-containing protein n=1 Tax=Streptomyces sp. NPDC046197 TaxID=3154337 RepID=UPI0033CC7E48